MELTRYSLIVDYSVWGKGKDHVAKEMHTVDSLCGKSLGFDYSPASVSTREGYELIELEKGMVNDVKNLCKTCKKILNKNK